MKDVDYSAHYAEPDAERLNELCAAALEATGKDKWLRAEELFTELRDCGLESWCLPDGVVVTAEMNLVAGFHSKKKQEAREWLSANGHADAINDNGSLDEQYVRELYNADRSLPDEFFLIKGKYTVKQAIT
jgi:hypothetical protein